MVEKTWKFPVTGVTGIDWEIKEKVTQEKEQDLVCNDRKGPKKKLIRVNQNILKNKDNKSVNVQKTPEKVLEIYALKYSTFKNKSIAIACENLHEGIYYATEFIRISKEKDSRQRKWMILVGSDMIDEGLIRRAQEKALEGTVLIFIGERNQIDELMQKRPYFSEIIGIMTNAGKMSSDDLAEAYVKKIEASEISLKNRKSIKESICKDIREKNLGMFQINRLADSFIMDYEI